MSEATIQADLQRELLKLTSLFSTGDVVIGDWRVLDGSSDNAPYAIIEVSDSFSFAGAQAEWSGVYSIPFTLIVKFTDWDLSMLAMRDARQTVIDALKSTTFYNSASTALAWGLRSIASSTSINPVYDRYDENDAESIPIFLSQQIILEVEETSEG